MTSPFSDGSNGEWMTEPEELENVFSIYWKAGFQIHLHTNGDKAMEFVLTNVRKMQKQFPRSAHKTTIEHAGFFSENQAQSLADLGCFVSAQPFYYYSLKVFRIFSLEFILASYRMS